MFRRWRRKESRKINKLLKLTKHHQQTSQQVYLLSPCWPISFIHSCPFSSPFFSHRSFHLSHHEGIWSGRNKLFFKERIDFMINSLVKREREDERAERRWSTRMDREKKLNKYDINYLTVKYVNMWREKDERERRMWLGRDGMKGWRSWKWRLCHKSTTWISSHSPFIRPSFPSSSLFGQFVFREKKYLFNIFSS